MEVVHTDKAPAAIGTYSQAVRSGNTVYISGQIPLTADSAVLVSEDVCLQIEQVFKNLQAVCKAANGSLNNIVKLNVYLIELAHFTFVNDAMKRYFKAPYPARAVVGVAELPKGAQVEADAVMVLDIE